MAYVADELGVDVLHVPQLQRDLSPLRDPVSIARLVEVVRRVRPHVLHTHTAKAGAVGRVAALLAGDARPPIIVHSSTATCCAATSTRYARRSIEKSSAGSHATRRGWSP